jgi:hypothetical protein
MIPFSQVEKLHAGSTLATYYFKNETVSIRGVPKACIDFTSCTDTALQRELRKSEGISIQLTILKAANSYWRETTKDWFYDLPGTAWIRLSTGKLCMDVGNGYESCLGIVRPWAHSELPEVKLTEYDLGDKLLSTLELDEFYSMVARFNTYLNSSPSMPGTITLPSICNPYGDRIHSKRDQFCAIPTAKHLTLNDLYTTSWHMGDLPQEFLPTGWTRCAYGCSAPSFPNNCSVGLIIQIVPMED